MVKLKKDSLIIAKKKFNSRLIVGTGKYKNMEECAKAIKLSGAEIVTVAVRRVNITDKKKPLLMDYINPKKITYLPNTAGCFNSKDALRTLRLAREIGGWKLVKLEVLGDKQNLFPDMIETLKSTEILAKEGFKVMVYCTDDPLLAKKLEENGASAIMPLASPIGSGSKESCSGLWFRLGTESPQFSAIRALTIAAAFQPVQRFQSAAEVAAVHGKGVGSWLGQSIGTGHFRGIKDRSQGVFNFAEREHLGQQVVKEGFRRAALRTRPSGAKGTAATPSAAQPPRQPGRVSGVPRKQTPARSRPMIL